MLQTGALLQNRYRIEQVLGQGRMGTVYLARHVRLGDRPLAIKELSEDNLNVREREMFLHQFEREARILAGLSHPNLVEVKDFFEEDGRMFLAMEYIEGHTLAVRMTRPIDWHQVLDWALQLVDVLDYLHGLPTPVVVRDLKPNNVMLQANGRVRLIDFGTAREVGEDKKSLTGMRLAGTPGYAPPELYGGRWDPRSDIYCLGATIHALCTGSVPVVSLMRVTGQERLVPLAEGDPAIPRMLSDAVEAMMALKPEDRPQSMADVRALLQPLAGDRVVSDAPPVRATPAVPAAPFAPLPVAVPTAPLMPLEEETPVVMSRAPLVAPPPVPVAAFGASDGLAAAPSVPIADPAAPLPLAVSDAPRLSAPFPPLEAEPPPEAARPTGGPLSGSLSSNLAQGPPRRVGYASGSYKPLVPRADSPFPPLQGPPAPAPEVAAAPPLGPPEPAGIEPEPGLVCPRCEGPLASVTASCPRCDGEEGPTAPPPLPAFSTPLTMGRRGYAAPSRHSYAWLLWLLLVLGAGAGGGWVWWKQQSHPHPRPVSGPKLENQVAHTRTSYRDPDGLFKVLVPTGWHYGTQDALPAGNVPQYTRFTMRLANGHHFAAIEYYADCRKVEDAIKVIEQELTTRGQAPRITRAASSQVAVDTYDVQAEGVGVTYYGKSFFYTRDNATWRLVLMSVKTYPQADPALSAIRDSFDPSPDH